MVTLDGNQASGVLPSTPQNTTILCLGRFTGQITSPHSLEQVKQVILLDSAARVWPVCSGPTGDHAAWCPSAAAISQWSPSPSEDMSPLWMLVIYTLHKQSDNSKASSKKENGKFTLPSRALTFVTCKWSAEFLLQFCSESKWEGTVFLPVLGYQLLWNAIH